MLYNFGKVFSLPHTKGRSDFQVNFIADRPTTSLVVLTIAADDIKTITRVAPGRIVSAYIESFEALSTTGTLLAIVQNTGTYTSTYNVRLFKQWNLQIKDQSIVERLSSLQRGKIH